MMRSSTSFANWRRSNSEPAAPSAASQAAAARAEPRRRARACDYDAPAGLYVRMGSRLAYRAFGSVSLALQHANENLTPRQLLSCAMEVDNARFTGDEVRALYLAPAYPLERSAMADAAE
jgi:hypothetical protein